MSQTISPMKLNKVLLSAMTDSPVLLTEFLKFAVQHPEYSASNLYLIYQQAPHAGRCFSDNQVARLRGIDRSNPIFVLRPDVTNEEFAFVPDRIFPAPLCDFVKEHKVTSLDETVFKRIGYNFESVQKGSVFLADDSRRIIYIPDGLDERARFDKLADFYCEYFWMAWRDGNPLDLKDNIFRTRYKPMVINMLRVYMNGNSSVTVTRSFTSAFKKDPAYTMLVLVTLYEEVIQVLEGLHFDFFGTYYLRELNGNVDAPVKFPAADIKAPAVGRNQPKLYSEAIVLSEAFRTRMPVAADEETSRQIHIYPVCYYGSH